MAGWNTDKIDKIIEDADMDNKAKASSGGDKSSTQGVGTGPNYYVKPIDVGQNPADNRALEDFIAGSGGGGGISSIAVKPKSSIPDRPFPLLRSLRDLMGPSSEKPKSQTPTTLVSRVAGPANGTTSTPSLPASRISIPYGGDASSITFAVLLILFNSSSKKT